MSRDDFKCTEVKGKPSVEIMNVLSSVLNKRGDQPAYFQGTEQKPTSVIV